MTDTTKPTPELDQRVVTYPEFVAYVAQHVFKVEEDDDELHAGTPAAILAAAAATMFLVPAPDVESAVLDELSRQEHTDH